MKVIGYDMSDGNSGVAQLIDEVSQNHTLSSLISSMSKSFEKVTPVVEEKKEKKQSSGKKVV